MPNYSINIDSIQVRVFINDVLHLSLKRDELIGMQTWIAGTDENRKFCIEFSTKTSEILCEYDCEEKWKDILDLFNKKNIY